MDYRGMETGGADSEEDIFLHSSVPLLPSPLPSRLLRFGMFTNRNYLRFCFRNLRGCNVGIAGEIDL
jgi:hypothetical protein